MLRTQPGTLGVLIAPREFTLATLRSVRYANASLNHAVFASGDGTEPFSRAGYGLGGCS